MESSFILSVLNMPIPGRRVFSSAISATIVGVDMRASFNTECNAPPFFSCGTITAFPTVNGRRRPSTLTG